MGASCPPPAPCCTQAAAGAAAAAAAPPLASQASQALSYDAALSETGLSQLSLHDAFDGFGEDNGEPLVKAPEWACAYVA